MNANHPLGLFNESIVPNFFAKIRNFIYILKFLAYFFRFLRFFCYLCSPKAIKSL